MSKRYRVLNEAIWYPPAAVVDRLLRGEEIPREERGEVCRRAGDIIDDLHPYLEAGLEGDIEEVDHETISASDVGTLDEAVWQDLGRKE